MTIKVLVVDDSSFFRRRVSEILNAEPMLEVIGVAKNGQEAIDMVNQLKPDVVTMDVEMPVLDGISAVREIMRQTPTPILMFSSMTHEGAQATFDALDAGALDFIPKKFEDIANNRDEAIKLLQNRVKAIARRKYLMRRTRSTLASTPTKSVAAPRTAPSPRSPSLGRKTSQTRATSSAHGTITVKRSGKQYRIVVIGTSTGGPVALQKVLTQLPGDFPHPILLIQHMPATFTPAFASRLNSLCKINIKEAENGDVLKPGWAYLAPGGMQMIVENHGANKLRIIEADDPKINYKPCVDITFASVAKAFNDKALAIVLTGMGGRWP